MESDLSLALEPPKALSSPGVFTAQASQAFSWVGGGPLCSQCGVVRSTGRTTVQRESPEL